MSVLSAGGPNVLAHAFEEFGLPPQQQRFRAVHEEGVHREGARQGQGQRHEAQGGTGQQVRKPREEHEGRGARDDREEASERDEKTAHPLRARRRIRARPATGPRWGPGESYRDVAVDGGGHHHRDEGHDRNSGPQRRRGQKNRGRGQGHEPGNLEDRDGDVLRHEDLPPRRGEREELPDRSALHSEGAPAQARGTDEKGQDHHRVARGGRSTLAGHQVEEEDRTEKAGEEASAQGRIAPEGADVLLHNGADHSRQTKERPAGGGPRHRPEVQLAPVNRLHEPRRHGDAEEDRDATRGAQDEEASQFALAGVDSRPRAIAEGKPRGRPAAHHEREGAVPEAGVEDEHQRQQADEEAAGDGDEQGCVAEPATSLKSVAREAADLCRHEDHSVGDPEAGGRERNGDGRA